MQGIGYIGDSKETQRLVIKGMHCHHQAGQTKGEDPIVKARGQNYSEEAAAVAGTSGRSWNVEEKQSLLEMPPEADRWAEKYPGFSLLLPSSLPPEPPTGQAQPEPGQNQHLGNVACKCQDQGQTPAKASCGSRNRPRILSGALVNLLKLLVRKLLYSFHLLSHFLSIQLKVFQRNTQVKDSFILPQQVSNQHT